jgi:Family of unknown function (DUF6064)
LDGETAVLPFTPEQFLAVFADYNNAIWPVQIVAHLLGGFAVILLFFKNREARNPIISGILALMWLWTGIGYHALWFSAINKAAYLFAALFVVQGCYFVYSGFSRQIHFGVRPDIATWVRLANQGDLFAENVVPISRVVGKIPELYAWLTYSAEKTGVLKHLCWAMPPADSGSWLAHINVLKRAEQNASDEAPPVEEPAKIIKLKFRDHIEEVLSKKDESDNEKET